MHLISHFSSGFCLGACLLPLNRNFPRAVPMAAPTFVALGSLLPDLDGISVFFAHNIYYGNKWYSHRGALHTPLGIALFLVLIACARYAVSVGREPSQLDHSRGAMLGFLYLGSLLHIVEDMMTPPGPWWGVMLFWPFSDLRVGGFAKVFWMNEYLIAVLSTSALLTFAILLLIRRSPLQCRSLLAGLMTVVSLGGLTEAVRFVSVSEFKDPAQWEAYQKDLLGEALYKPIHRLLLTTQEIWVRELL